MRRRDRYIVNTALVTGGVTALFDVLMQIREHNEAGQSLTWETFDGWRTVKKTAIGAAVGGGVGYVFYQYRISQEELIPFNPDSYLKEILTHQNLKSDPRLFQNVLRYREFLKGWLFNAFGQRLVAMPEDAGSFYKRTAIASNYDLDIILAFKKNSYLSLEDMFYAVYEKLDDRFGNVAKVTKQTKAIGLTFDNDGDPIHFDIVPGREINDYKFEKDLNLYVDSDSIWRKGSSFKTNVEVHKLLTVNQPEARRVIKLLKIYRDKNNLHLPSVLIEQCVVKALSSSRYGNCTSDTQNLLNCMCFISQKLEHSRIVDIYNTNHNLQDKLQNYQRDYVISQLRSDVEKVDANPRYLKEIFDYY